MAAISRTKDNLLDHLGFVGQLVGRRPFGLLTDFDGTISEIVSKPEEAAISPLCRRHLLSLSKKVALVAVVSGRPAAKLARMADVPGAVYIGNHGLERVEGDEVSMLGGVEEYIPMITEIKNRLAKELSEVRGLLVEDKGPVLSLHYRNTSDPRAAERRILERLQDYVRAGKITIGRGRMVIEVRPPMDFSKGTAVDQLIAERALRAGVYIGDDLTDIEAMAEMRRSRRGNPFLGLAVAVVDDETSPEVARAADFILGGTGQVEAFLQKLDEMTAHTPAT